MTIILISTILGSMAAVVGTIVGLIQLWERGWFKRPKPGPKPPLPPATTTSESVTFCLKAQRIPGLCATARESDGHFVVLKDSAVRKGEESGLQDVNKQRREYLLKNGKLRDGGIPECWLLIEDTSFDSPSAAAAVILGRSASGTVEWHVEKTGQTYGEWNDQQVKH